MSLGHAKHPHGWTASCKTSCPITLGEKRQKPVDRAPLDTGPQGPCPYARWPVLSCCQCCCKHPGFDCNILAGRKGQNFSDSIITRRTNPSFVINSRTTPRTLSVNAAARETPCNCGFMPRHQIWVSARQAMTGCLMDAPDIER